MRSKTSPITYASAGPLRTSGPRTCTVEGLRHERHLRDATARGHGGVERVAHVADRVAVVEVEAHLEPGLVADEHLHPARDASGEPDHTAFFDP